ncbi:class II aldolase/adducin family protein [Cupriavidus consociatus]|uniref:class II aldolase/adducin family protein n=1 Tax=Cupriavidus consociatus TaxID=2821357 RepID=UPI001FD86215|nr:MULTISPECIES: class II aldolase/adducin family protein [unclassified Cupriavidus]MDK2657650.1 class II aldolase/adducin family protein [Cupriavidus sp. LEh21]
MLPGTHPSRRFIAQAEGWHPCLSMEPSQNMCTHHFDVAVAAYADDAAIAGAAASPALIDDLVTANHILFDQGIVDAFGHVSVRHDHDPERFLLARNMAPATVTADDIVEFMLDGTPVNAAGRAVYLERFIHGEIYRSRPDVKAIVHSHSPTVLPFSVSKGTRFRPVCHMSGFLGGGTPVFEIREAAGDGTDLLIRDRNLGAALAQTLGESSFVLMRGHGSTVVGPSLRHAVYRAVYAEVNARLQVEAVRLGEVTYLSDKEAEAAQRNIETQIDRPWMMWKRRVQSGQASAA